MASTTFDPRGKDQPKSGEHFDRAKDAGMEAMNKGKEAGREAMTGAKEASAEALQKAKEAGTDVIGKARDAAAAAGDAASEAACAVGHKANDVTAAAGHQIREFGDTIARKSPHDGIAGAASQAVADTIKGSGRYIEEAKLTGMAEDVENVVKTHPIPALLICLGVGFCLGRMFKD
jgi:hypothetical protein